MLGLPLAFTVPLALGALALLPALYFLLRITPPPPRRTPFPPLRLILDLRPTEETPSRTPWPLLLLRLAIAALIIFAMAGPVWRPAPEAQAGGGPLVIVLDDGWPAAPTWDQRVKIAAQRIDAAARRSQPVALVAASDAGRDIAPMDPEKALERLHALKPAPYVADRTPVLGAIARFCEKRSGTSILWLADGVERGNARSFAEGLKQASGNLAIIVDADPARALAGPDNQSGGLEARLLRSSPDGPEQGAVRALDAKGLAIGSAPFDFSGAIETKVRFELPVELRNEVSRLEIVGEHSAGAVSLLDERWRRRRIGLFSGETADVAQPLLSPKYYLMKALAPFADVLEPRPGAADPVQGLLDERVTILILADVGAVSPAARDGLRRFVDEGGVLVRFAGSRLAASSDDLAPVRLRRGGRVLGGAMSWDKPKNLAPFERQSPFFGLNVPAEVTVTRQVLAEPDPGLPAKTWAQLSDGTPLVTAAREGKGLNILFHVTADTTWSNLPLSGLFVEMLRKIVTLSGQASISGETEPSGGTQNASIPPLRTLDGFGVLGPPPPNAKPISLQFAGIADAEHPPGLYGQPDALIAVNTLGPQEGLDAADYSGLGAALEPLRGVEPVDLKPWLIAAALMLFCADALASLWFSGGFSRLSRRAAAAVVLAAFVGAMAAAPQKVDAQAAVSKKDFSSALTTRLAYVASGDAKVDEVSRQGLASLSRVLARRTSLTPGEPVGVDPGRDELAFYPLLYWPIVANRPIPPQAAIEKISAFMKQGGTIIFDTRDAPDARAGAGPTPEAKWLREMLAGVDVPELESVPADHVVTKTFYLISGFIGRYTTGATWIEALPPNPAEAESRPVRSGDAVSPIIITSNDLAAGWASDADGESLYALSPGGRRQHELALRGGVNLVIYTLTGNYKSDQVHVRDLLERLAH
ncbi:DUF4159 domain-containing protein [Methylocapsa palsarum]|uniref:N-terminal double-transmembrane domain-containing protein n=1 Tax=Methylocapsa palsarum TaxID=1612308 RepID=A0A1I3WWJ0_9HYPH|nr:DUF4159 domain-containing protein [Methylocapsa palsarum]SFK11307.1 N-terminal double-transmembrane domain-containing protein [Methylocapsa palsarum]